MIAIRLNIYDHPISDIKTHKIATPYLGGIAIWGGWIVSLFIIRLFTHFPTGTLRSLRGIITGSIIILCLGLFDDVLPRGLGFKKKFLVQSIAAVCIIMFGVRLQFVNHPIIATVFSILWVVGITNAFNIIDIMDGLSSGIAIIASLAFFFIAIPSEQIYVNFCALALAGACLGFIPYNVSRNMKIFMGDTGSLVIGLILAAEAMGTSYTKLNYIGLFAPILILAIPIYDTLLVMYLRWRKGKSPFLGSKDHFALRLERMGYDRKQILAMTYAASILLSCGAFLVTRLTFDAAAVLCVVILATALWISYRLSLVKID
jgi:UDP-GlcNAc:undecaprenyl-phosphate GlcNAc-1-phosphate transferase